VFQAAATEAWAFSPLAEAVACVVEKEGMEEFLGSPVHALRGSIESVARCTKGMDSVKIALFPTTRTGLTMKVHLARPLSAAVAAAAALVVIIQGCVSVPSPAPKIGAKEAYSIADPYALAGDPSARLESIRTDVRSWQKDGRSSEWHLTFCSSETGTTLRLYIKDRRLFAVGDPIVLARDKEPSEAWSFEGSSRCEPVTQWIDSTEAIERALAHANTSWLWSMEMVSGKWHFRFYWPCRGGIGSLIDHVNIDVSTGAFLGTQGPLETIQCEWMVR